MKNPVPLIIVFLLSVILYSCSGSDEIVIVTEEKIIRTDTPTVNPTKKEKITDTSDADISTTDVTSEWKYTVQLGAFRNMSNASKSLERARIHLGETVEIHLIDGLYKVRSNIFGTSGDALRYSAAARNAGFYDAYVIVIKPHNISFK